MNLNPYICEIQFKKDYEILEDCICNVAGNNVLEIDVTSTWFNRLTYDAGLDESDRKTWVIHGPASGSELRPYGLLGSVVVRYCEK